MNAAYVCMIFLILLTFFLKIRPPIVHNGDDWAYISFQRPAMPVWHEWNPSRVLPECLLPLCAHFAVTFVMPLCHDYIWSITIVCCVVLCAIITLYLCLFGGLLRREMKLSAECTALCVLLLLIVHFRSWMSPWIPGEHLFHSVDLNNYFYYTIPVLVNACLVILFEQKREMVESFGKNEKMTEKGLLLLMIYFAVFSNMYGNCVLAIYSGICFLENIWTGWKSSRSIKAVLQKVSVYVLVLFLWCVCAIFEINGGRAAGFLGGGAAGLYSYHNASPEAA